MICGAELRSSAKFCDSCGGPVAASGAPAEYKQVTVLFADVVRSMDIATVVGAERWREICTPDEIAAEVWRQIISALTSNAGSVAAEVMPWPAWYALDRGLIMATGPGQGQGRVVRNESPYLVPIVGDWTNRPGSDPWNPHESSWTSTPPEDWWLEDLEQRNVWQARHGGYQVHNNSVVFAGTWSKTFTRVTSMESACESGRHAVNAILDHYVWVASGGLDRRDKTTLSWEFPFGFLDQGLSSPIRLPTPAGDYCYIFDIENREPADTRPLRTLDSFYCEQSLPPPWDCGIPPAPHPATRWRSRNVHACTRLQPAVVCLSADLATGAGAVGGHGGRRITIPDCPLRLAHGAFHGGGRAIHAAHNAVRATHAALYAAHAAGAHRFGAAHHSGATRASGLHPTIVQVPSGVAPVP